jgi:hypothetical protein
MPLAHNVIPITRARNEAIKRIFLYAHDPAPMLDRAIRRNTPGFKLAFRKAWEDQAHLIKRDAIEYAISHGTLPEYELYRMSIIYSDTIVNKIMPIWRDTAEANLTNILDKALTLRGGAVSDYLESKVYLDANRILTQRAMERGVKWVVDASKIQSEAIRGVIETYGLQAHLPAQELAKMLEPTIGLLPRESAAVARYRAALIEGAGGKSTAAIDRSVAAKAARLHNARAVRIARTETAWAQNQGAIDGAKSLMDNDMLPSDTKLMKRWETAEDEATCAICGPMQGAEAELDEPFDTDNGPVQVPTEVHPNCILADTAILASNILNGISSFYKGIVIKIFLADGNTISVTPNHMLLTPYGFIFAKALREGDDVISCPDFKRVITGDPNDNGQPARIDNILKSFSESGGSTSARVPTSSEYLHGDGKFCKGNINIVRADGFLRDANNPSRFKHTNGYRFNTRRDIDSLVSGGALAKFFNGALTASHGVMGRARESLALFNSRMLHAGEHSFAFISKYYPAFSKIATDYRAATFKSLGKFQHRYAGIIQPAKIVGIQKDFLSTHVFDLHTQSSLYIGNGVMSSNCRCSSVIVTAEK